MSFNSTEFLIFFPIVLLIYYILPKRVSYLWLLICSYYFYMCWSIRYALLMLFSTVVTYTGGIIIEKAPKKQYKKLAVILSFGLNLAVLFLFKYIGLAANLLHEALNLVHIQLRMPAFDMLLPVGISFYTFQALGYTIDVYRRETYAEKNFLRYALFVSFFPQLVAGPIERSKHLLRQLAVPRQPNMDSMRDGLLLMIWGFFLKIVLADRITIFVDTVYADYMTYAGWYLAAATVLFAFQIYCDFYGYSAIAVGAAEMLGIHLMENFDAPYLSVSVGEFWRKWHISLTSWFKDYLYIPLGGSRKGKFRKYVNKLIVFMASGLWHGAKVSFVVWGLCNGLYQVVAEMAEPYREKVAACLHLHRNSLAHKLARMLGTFLLIDATWIFFRAERFRVALDIIKQMFTVKNMWILFDGSLYQCGLDEKNFRLMLLCLCILLAADVCRKMGIKVRKVVAAQDFWFRCLFLTAAVCAVITFGLWGPGYQAAGFIYFQF